MLLQTDVAVIPDIGGNAKVFRALVAAVGGNLNEGYLPEGLVVVQAGDLVHKGPDSRWCVQAADRMLRNYPDRWIQLIGNHEAHYLGGPSVAGRVGVSELDAETAAIIQRWWNQRQCRLAVAVASSNGPVLISHAGMTSAVWDSLDRPDAEGCAAAVNQWIPNQRDVAFTPGVLHTGNLTPTVGLCWADVAQELTDPWLTRFAQDCPPFDQVHGHANLWNWDRDRWQQTASPQAQATTTVNNRDRRCSTLLSNGTTIHSIDWVSPNDVQSKLWPGPHLITQVPAGSQVHHTAA